MIVLLLRPFSRIVFTALKRSWKDFGYILPVVLRLFWIPLSGLEKRRVVRGNGLQGYQVSYDDSLASLQAGYWCVCSRGWGRTFTNGAGQQRGSLRNLGGEEWNFCGLTSES